MEQSTGLKINKNTGMRILNPDTPKLTPELKTDVRALSNKAKDLIMHESVASIDGIVSLPSENPDIVAEKASASVPESKFDQFSPVEKPF